MKKSLILKLTILLLITTSLSGCLVVERRNGLHPVSPQIEIRGEIGGNDGGNHHSKKHDH